MALTLAESAALINDLDFRGRVKVAALQYATYVFSQAGQSNSRMAWAQRTMQQPDTTAQTLTPAVVMNINVQSLGKDIDDDNLRASVQVTADLMI